MDVGKFKANTLRLTAWILIPPLIVVGLGLSSFALKQQSEWKLNRVKGLSDVLPRLVHTREKSGELIKKFEASDVLKSEDELISYLQNTAREAGFTVDELTVDRRDATDHFSMPVLAAKVEGSGSFDTIQKFLRDATANQYLLYESSLNIRNRSQSAYGNNERLADITFELILFDEVNHGGGDR